MIDSFTNTLISQVNITVSQLLIPLDKCNTKNGNSFSILHDIKTKLLKEDLETKMGLW